MGCVNFSVQPSENYKEWFSAVYMFRNAITRAAGENGLALPLVGSVAIEAIVYRDADRGDALGYYEAIADAIQADQYLCERCRKKMYTVQCQCGQVGKHTRKGLGIILDDKQALIWDGSRILVDRKRPRIELTVRVLEEKQIQLEL